MIIDSFFAINFRKTSSKDKKVAPVLTAVELELKRLEQERQEAEERRRQEDEKIQKQIQELEQKKFEEEEKEKLVSEQDFTHPGVPFYFL